MKINRTRLAVCIIIPLSVGGLSSIIIKDGFSAFEIIKKPPLSPPSWLFPIVWTLLYILMGIASYLVSQVKCVGDEKINALFFYALGLIFNFFWPILFFGFFAYFISFAWLVLLWGIVFINTVKFYKISKLSGYLILPYLLWITFAGYLNLAIFLLNRA